MINQGERRFKDNTQTKLRSDSANVTTALATCVLALRYHQRFREDGLDKKF